MARKAEAGIEYFPMNSDIIHNPKIKLVVAEFGPETWAVLLPLYCKIYREKGYWMDWHDEDSKLLFTQDECKVKRTFLDEVVKGCLRRSLFNQRVFEMFEVLTSDRIQENFLIAKKRNQSVDFIDEFNVLSKDVLENFKNVNIIDLNVNIITKKVNIGTQNKKEKEIIEVEAQGSKTPHTQEQQLLFKKFQDWILEKTPRVNKLKEPLTIEQYFKLREKFTKDVLTKVLLAMQNRADLLKKYVSAYLTINNWSSREETNVKTEQTNGSNINEQLKNAGKGSQA